MQNLYWERFKQTGKVDDYIGYRERETCMAIASEYPVVDRENDEENGRESSSYSDGYGA